MFHLTILCFCLPSLILAVPANDEVLKQQIASEMMKNEEMPPYWSLLRPDNNNPISLQLRSIDSLGHGHILRSLGEGDSSWLGSGSGGNMGWRLTGYNGGLKRGGGLDSLGRGNILRSIPAEDYQRYLKSLDSLGRALAPNGAKMWRRFDSLGGDAFGFQKRFDSLSGRTFGHQKRNFDEIDNAGFGAFVKKNFDEIDNVGMGFKKRERQFDEIDNAGFGAFVKRN